MTKNVFYIPLCSECGEQFVTQGKVHGLQQPNTKRNIGQCYSCDKTIGRLFYKVIKLKDE